MGGEEDGGAALGEVAEDVANGAHGDGVNAVEGFVEEHDAGVMDEGGGEGDLLAENGLDCGHDLPQRFLRLDAFHYLIIENLGTQPTVNPCVLCN